MSTLFQMSKFQSLYEKPTSLVFSEWAYCAQAKLSSSKKRNFSMTPKADSSSQICTAAFTPDSASASVSIASRIIVVEASSPFSAGPQLYDLSCHRDRLLFYLLL